MVDLFKTMPDFACKHKVKRCTVNGKEMFCTDLRIMPDELPNGLYAAEVRGNMLDYSKWETIEHVVGANFTATLISDEPFVLTEHYDQQGRMYPYTQVEEYEIDY